MRQELSDGDLALLGVFGSVHRAGIPAGFAADAVNWTFREGACGRIRPRFVELTTSFESDEEQERFETGAFQGAMAYQATSTGTDAGMLAAIDGAIWFLRLVGNTMRVRKLYDGLRKDLLNVWFVQAEERAYWQNDYDPPGGWDGFSPDGFRVSNGDGSDNKLPTGNVMAFNHGRLAVANKFNQIAVSDHLYGNGFSDRANIESFLENTAYVGGTFSPPSVLGEIVSILTLPAVEDRNYHGDLVMLCRNGAATLDISGPREGWQDAKVLWVGPGSASSWGWCYANNDVWFLRPDGLQTLKLAYQRDATKWTEPVLSRPVDHLLRYDSQQLRQFQPMGFFDNRVLVGVMPTTQNAATGGQHRFCRAMLVADLLGQRTAQEEFVAWEGLWTGVQPTYFAEINAPLPRAVIMSFDGERNRVFELSRGFGSDTTTSGSRQIEGILDTRAYAFGSQLIPKEFIGSGRTRIVLNGEGSYSAAVRPDENDEWIEVVPEQSLGSFNCEGCPDKPPTPKSWTDVAAGSVTGCNAAQGVSKIGLYWQMRHRLSGDGMIPMIRIKAYPDADDTRLSCQPRNYAEDSAICGDPEMLSYKL